LNHIILLILRNEQLRSDQKHSDTAFKFVQQTAKIYESERFSLNGMTVFTYNVVEAAFP
jgi:hypothetical protein